MNNFKCDAKEKSVGLQIYKLISFLKNKPFVLKGALVFCTLLVVFSLGSLILNSIKNIHNTDLEADSEISIIPIPVAEITEKKNIIEIPTGVVKAHPFLPYRTLKGEDSLPDIVNDIPAYNLVAPPDFHDENSEAAKIMNTVVSGILYDKYSPSAILNIEGNDHLVKKGDMVKNYKVLNITRNSVTVQLGKNTYNAGIGEILTDGTLNYNEVSNLHKKFGGELR